MQPIRFLLLLPGAMALSGCIAAAIPVVAGGVVARSAATRSPPRQAAPPRTGTPPATPAPELPAMPGDLAVMRPGQIYRGAMPVPATAPPAPAPATATATAPATATATAPSPAVATGWADVGHHVAADLSPAHGVLMARGSDAANPRWLDCGAKPRAVIATAATLGGAGAIDPAARSWLEALRVMDVRPVIVVGSAAEAEPVKAMLARAGLGTPVDGDTLLIAAAPDRMPAIRADAGSRYCVLAIVGRSAADFPNGLTPATTPASLAPLWGHGWFLLTGP